MSDKHPNPTTSRHRSTAARKRSRVSTRWRRMTGSGAPRRNPPPLALNQPPLAA